MCPLKLEALASLNLSQFLTASVWLVHVAYVYSTLTMCNCVYNKYFGYQIWVLVEPFVENGLHILHVTKWTTSWILELNSCVDYFERELWKRDYWIVADREESRKDRRTNCNTILLCDQYATRNHCTHSIHATFCFEAT